MGQVTHGFFKGVGFNEEANLMEGFQSLGARHLRPENGTK